MPKFISITRTQAENLIKWNRTFINVSYTLLPYDLKNSKPIPKRRIDKNESLQIIKMCKTFILNKDADDEDDENEVLILSMYTELQKDIYNILQKGLKYDLIIINNCNVQ